jgi:fructoselysine 6-kinase
VKVLGIGDNVVDKYIHIKTMYPGGNALNFSAFAKKRGVEAAFLGTFGSDKEAKYVESVLNELQIDISRCRYYPGENGCARVTLEEGERIFLGSNEGGVTRDNLMKLTDEDKSYISKFSIIHTGLYSHTAHLLSDIKELGVPLSFDFSDDFDNKQIESYIPYTDFAFFSCSHISDADTHKFLHTHFKNKGQILIATRGSERAIAYDGTEFCYQDPKYVIAKDTMGAGDSFITAFLLNYLKSKDISLSMGEAASFAANSCLVEGSFGFGMAYE